MEYWARVIAADFRQFRMDQPLGFIGLDIHGRHPGPQHGMPYALPHAATGVQRHVARPPELRRSTFDRGGLSAAVELRRLFPGVTDNTQAREYHRWLEAAAREAPVGQTARQAAVADQGGGRFIAAGTTTPA
jgi:hypothetical protein